MPLYTVYHPPTLSADIRSQIATVITDSHVSATNAPAFLVKVIFISLESTSFYSGGHVEEKLLRIVGVIRAGRSKEERQKLLMSIYDGINIYEYDVEMHLEDMKAENIIINGKFLPEPGSADEKRWKDAGKPV